MDMTRSGGGRPFMMLFEEPFTIIRPCNFYLQIASSVPCQNGWTCMYSLPGPISPVVGTLHARA